ncbi:MAG: hypothetical protein NUV45_09270 [Tepidanaerobacteraceae bacterium]|nr:hypothetical protein [Tepidanaerobacteraceae bacterium]
MFQTANLLNTGKVFFFTIMGELVILYRHKFSYSSYSKIHIDRKNKNNSFGAEKGVKQHTGRGARRSDALLFMLDNSCSGGTV